MVQYRFHQFPDALAGILKTLVDQPQRLLEFFQASIPVVLQLQRHTVVQAIAVIRQAHLRRNCDRLAPVVGSADANRLLIGQIP